jgi:ABC-type polysaccharide/polyol phosphate export permease
MSFLINQLNPVSSFIVSARDLATLGFIADPIGLTLSYSISFFLFLLGWRLMHLVEPKIAERV